jgi:hypothetical protein
MRQDSELVQLHGKLWILGTDSCECRALLSLLARGVSSCWATGIYLWFAIRERVIGLRSSDSHLIYSLTALCRHGRLGVSRVLIIV